MSTLPMSTLPLDQVHVPPKSELLNELENGLEFSNQEIPQKSAEQNMALRFLHRVTTVLTRCGVETHGIAPIPVERRVDTRWYQIFFFWLSSSTNILAFATGTSGPAFFSLSARDSILIIVVVGLVMSLPPALFVVFGPKLGMRAMVQSRFSWGYYGSIIPCVLNAFTMQGYLVLNCILGGQTLASMSSHLNDTLGIVIISLISLVVAFCGYHFLHWYESISWMPNVAAWIAMLVIGYPQLHANQLIVVPPPPISSVISYASVVATSFISNCTLSADYGVYHSPSASSTRIFIYAYIGLIISNVSGEIIGATFAAAAPNVPVWDIAFQNGNSAGGLLYGILSPLGGFGKFLALLVVLTIPSACVPTMYSFSTSMMSVAHCFTLVPRWVYILISEAILVPVAILGAEKFYTTFVDMVDVIGYWTGIFAGIVLAEHVLFRGASLTQTAYPIEAWNVPGLLPRSLPAVLAFLIAGGALVPFISQAWYEGPVAREGSGDCGIFVGFVVSMITYATLRGLERWWDRRREGWNLA